MLSEVWEAPDSVGSPARLRVEVIAVEWLAIGTAWFVLYKLWHPTGTFASLRTRLLRFITLVRLILLSPLFVAIFTYTAIIALAVFLFWLVSVLLLNDPEIQFEPNGLPPAPTQLEK